MTDGSPEAATLLELLGKFTRDSFEVSGLDEKSMLQVRIAALVAIDAPPASYLMNLGAASELGFEDKDVMDILAAVAPIVGTTRIMSSMGKIARALGLAIATADEF
jgi:hypothetical protein